MKKFLIENFIFCAVLGYVSYVEKAVQFHFYCGPLKNDKLLRTTTAYEKFRKLTLLKDLNLVQL